MTATTSTTNPTTTPSNTRSGVSLGRVAFAFFVTVAFDLFIAVYFGGMNSLTGDSDFSNGFDKVGLLFGGIGNMLSTLVTIAVLGGIAYAIYSASTKDKHKTVVVLAVALAVAVYIVVQTNSFNPSWNMFMPVVIVALLAFQTWVTSRTFKK